MSRKLLVNDGKRERELVLVEKIVVGRDPTCDLSHDDALLSRRHAEFIAGPGWVSVRDLGSRNGTFVNGTRAAERFLAPGDIVQIGPLRVRYAEDGAQASILPELLIADATVVIPPRSARPANPPFAPASRDLGDPGPQDDHTRVVSRPVESKRSATPKPPPPAIDPALQDGPTLFMAPPPASVVAQPPATAPMAAIVTQPTSPRTYHPDPAAPSVPHDLESDISGYVFIQVAALAAVVLLASLVPLLVGRGAALSIWVGVPLVAAVMTTYLVARLINRRFLRILRSVLHDVPRGGDPFR